MSLMSSITLTQRKGHGFPDKPEHFAVSFVISGSFPQPEAERPQASWNTRPIQAAA